MTIALGIDGGGTHTRAALLDSNGRLLGVGQSAAGNLHDVGEERLHAHVAEATRAAWSEAGEAPQEAAAAFFGMASVVTEVDRERVRRIGLELELAPDGRIEVDHDLRIALAAGLAGAPGIVVIAGTGSSCYGRSPAGETWMASGWGSFPCGACR